MNLAKPDPASVLASRLSTAALLATAMLATRLGHFEGLPDASWAVLFLGGAWLRRPSAFLLLMVEAVGIDWLATSRLGVSGYCLSPAYAALLPAYGLLWLGGMQASGIVEQTSLRKLPKLAFTWFLAASGCFLVSNGSFYWFSGRVSSATLAGWASNLADWYLPYVMIPLLYILAAVALSAAIRKSRQTLSASDT